MDASKPTTFSLNIPQLLRYRNSAPDVPEDVDLALQHFNDPNYDLRRLSSDYSDSTIDTDDKKDMTAFSSGYSERSSEIDTESQTDYIGRSKIQLSAAEDLEEYVSNKFFHNIF